MHDDLKAALEVLQKGGVILYPADTFWGLGCDALNEQAIQRIYTITQKSNRNDIVVLMENAALIERYIDDTPEIAYDLIELSEKPLTLMLDGARNVAKNLISNDGTIGIRITTEKFSSELIRRFKRPIVFAEINHSGNRNHKHFSDIDLEIIKSADYTVNFRQDEQADDISAGIIKLGRGGEIKIIRN